MATLPSLHDDQQAVWDEKVRFRVLACGRRWGKTRLGSLMCTTTAMMGGRAWWVAPSYPVASVGWRGIKELAMQIPGADPRQGDRLITMPSGGTVQVRSADNPDSLRGEGLDFVVLDECAFIKEAAWAEALRPALSDRQGKALFISTPKGRNWFWRLWTLGNGGDDSEWRSWRFPTSSNPFIPESEIEAARKSLPERVFQQEYLAEFIDDAGGVFRGVMAAATAEPRTEAEDGHEYVFGVDWGRSNDFTVICVVDMAERELVAMDRFNQIDYTMQTARLKALAERFKPNAIYAESNSMGQPIIDQMVSDGLPVYPFLTTNQSKDEAVKSLALAFERGEIRILNEPALVNELQAYEQNRLPSGLMRYEAPEGMHDDTVMALMIAWSAVGNRPWYIW